MMKIFSRPRSSFLISILGSLFALLLLHAAQSSEIKDAVQPFVDRHELAGAVMLVASKDKILSLDAMGYSDATSKTPMRSDALFWIASTTKAITATALMLLIDEGKVRLDDPVEKYLPDFKPRIVGLTADGTKARLQEPKHPLVVRNLLNNTSGLRMSSAFETPRLRVSTIDTRPLELRVQAIALEPLLFEPGSMYSYSNAGFNTAARLIEVVSGMKYERFLRERLFDPLGMEDTTFWPTKSQLARLAQSHRPNASKPDLEATPIALLSYPLDDRAHRHLEAGGGLFSTATDMGRFCQMVLNEGVFEGKRYLSVLAIREMTRNQLSPEITLQMTKDVNTTVVAAGLPGVTGYGLGWMMRTGRQYGHHGAYGTNINIQPAHGLITVWMVQHSAYLGNGHKSESAFMEAVERMLDD